MKQKLWIGFLALVAGAAFLVPSAQTVMAQEGCWLEDCALEPCANSACECEVVNEYCVDP